MSDNNIVTGHFEADGAAIYLPIGFIPDYFRMVDYHTDTNIIVYEWWYDMQLDQGTGKQEGISYTEGVTANLADDGGFAAYDSRSDAPTVLSWTTAVSTAATARSATAEGTFVKPSTSGTMNNGQEADRSMIFECVTAGTGGATEPSWPVNDGAQVTDGTTVWEKVVEPTYSKGYQGVRIAAALMTDGQEVYYLAMRANTSKDHGDVTLWTDGISPDVL